MEGNCNNFTVERNCNNFTVGECARKYISWGFTPIPVRDYLKFPAHLRISQYSAEQLADLSRTTSFTNATGIWLLSHEPARDDGYIHIGIDLDVVPADLSSEARRYLDELSSSSFAYRTARGIHIHLFVPANELPLNRRKLEVISRGDHVADIFVFAPADDKRFTGSWRVGMLAYPSSARDDKTEGHPVVQRVLLSSGLHPPAKVGWDAVERLFALLYGDYSFGGGGSGGGDRIHGVAVATAHADGGEFSGTVSVVEDNVAQVLRLLRNYSCASAFLPETTADGVITAPPPQKIREGSRNTILFSLLALANRVASPLSSEVLVSFARAMNSLLFDPPLPDAEVIRTVQSVVGKGYTLRASNFAEKVGTTDRCGGCPLFNLCQCDDYIDGVEPEFEFYSSEMHFPSEYFRGEVQKELYKSLVSAVQNSSTKIVLGIAPTGSGKTLHSTGLASLAVREREAPVVVLAPTKQLQWQHAEWLTRANLPHVVFRGRNNFLCPLLRECSSFVLADRETIENGNIFSGMYPCAVSKDCVKMRAVFEKLQKWSAELKDNPSARPNLEDLIKKSQELVDEFATTLTASLTEIYDAPVDKESMYEALPRIVKDVSAICPYLQMISRVRTYSQCDPPGVIVANSALSFVLGMVDNNMVKLAQQGISDKSGRPKQALAVLDEAHKLLDSLFEPFYLRHISQAVNNGAVIDLSVTPGALLENEFLYAVEQEVTLRRDLRQEVQAGNRQKIVGLLGRLRSARNYLNRLSIFMELVNSSPKGFVIDTDTKMTKQGAYRRVFVRVLKNHRAQALKTYLSIRFPNTQFVLLTATGTELLPIADKVVKSSDVIPDANRRIIYAPLRRMSASALRERTRHVYRSDVVPAILAQYAALAPVLSERHGVAQVRGIVHETSKVRAVYLARAIAEAGYKLVLYAGGENDWANVPSSAKVDYDAILGMDNVEIKHRLEDAVSEFKKNNEHTFFVSVALDTGHDFDEDDIMLQWVVKIPFPQLNDPDYVLIERAEGPYERRKQYAYDTLQQLIQMAGRTTRKPEQFSLTIVLDKAFPDLLASAWQYGYKDDTLSIASRLVVSDLHREEFEKLPEPIFEKITFNSGACWYASLR